MTGQPAEFDIIQTVDGSWSNHGGNLLCMTPGPSALGQMGCANSESIDSSVTAGN